MFSPLIDPFALEMHARQRQEETLRRAAHERLLHAIRRAQPRPPGLTQRLVQWIGAQLVRWGYRLLPLRLPFDSARPAQEPWLGEDPRQAGEDPPRRVVTRRRAYGAAVARGICRPAGARLPHGYSLVGR